MCSPRVHFVRLRAFAERYTAAWCSHDPTQVAAFYAIDGTLRINDGSPSTGRAAIAEAARQFITAFPDLHVAMDELRVESDEPEYHWTLTGTHTGPGGSGRAVRISGFEKWRLSADGLIAYSQGKFDEEDYGRQLAGG